jgi:hypothetical protein
METKPCAACKQERPRSMFAPCKKNKGGLYSYCRDCVRLRNIAFYAKNRDRERQRVKDQKALDPELTRAALASWRARNSDHCRAYSARNADRINATWREWARNNPDLVRAHWRQRRAAMRQATPSWANRFFMAEAYRLAKLRSAMLGQEWHVDHIVPLQSDLVCGLHCEANLRVIPAPDNRAKFNTYWPDMPV